MRPNDSDTLPLTGLNILDCTDGLGEMCPRMLADLGADVLLVEPLGGNSARSRAPLVDHRSAYFICHNANKRSVQLNPESVVDRAHFYQLLSQADLLIHNNNLQQWQLELDELRRDYSDLIELAITDFGLTGPYRNWTATNATHLTLTGVVARSGIKGREPLLPPGSMACEAAAIQAAWCALLAVLYRKRTGLADRLDFSVFEATAQLIDPGLGVTGSAAAGKTAAQIAQKGRPSLSPFYPIFPCKNGFVRICILNPRQWQGMSDWLGDDHPFRDKKFGKISERFKVIKDINRLIAALFTEHNGCELVEQGQARGIPIAQVASPAEVFIDDQFQARQAFTPYPLPNTDKTAQLASGFVEVDGKRACVRTPAPELSDTALHNHFLANKQPLNTTDKTCKQPLDGIRVLDLGVIVAGAELGRLLADQGAEVIKIENKAFPDGLRQSHDGSPITPSFAQGSRGKLSFGLNLRHPQGIEIFKQLVCQSDIVLSNFKPGTMESLGLGFAELKAINPRIIVADSSALGSTGPRAKSMGYGPLVRASTGLTGLWRYPDDESGGFSDGITIYPDHFAARVSAVAIISLLLRRQRTGTGGEVSLSQAEVILNAMATEFFMESVRPGSLKAQGNQDASALFSSLFPCAGVDQWCMISVTSQQQWQALIQLCDQQLLPPLISTVTADKQHQQIEKIISDWTQRFDAQELMEKLQGSGIPAAKMMRIEELMQDPQLRARGFFRKLNQPGIATTLVTENSPTVAQFLPEPLIRPAPFMGEHTKVLAKKLLRCSDEQIQQWLDEGILEANETLGSNQQ